MIVGQGQLKEILTSIHPGTLSPMDAEAIVELAQLMLDADGREDTDEIKTFFALGKVVFGMAGMGDAATPTFLNDDEDYERMRELAGTLSSAASKELALATAHLLSISDVAIAPEEDEFISVLIGALGLTEERAEAIAETVNTAITPGAGDAGDIQGVD